MGIFSALLPVVGGLLGARSEAKARARSDYMNSPQGIRANAEAAGFNPLVFAGPGTGTGAQYAPQMGSIISNAFASAANQITREKELEIANQQLELERDRLQEAVQRSTLQPEVGGIYQQRPQQVRSGDPSGTPNRTDPDAPGFIPPERDLYNLYIDVYDPQTGRIVSIPNPDLMDTGPTEAAYGMASIGAADAAQNGLGIGSEISSAGTSDTANGNGYLLTHDPYADPSNYAQPETQTERTRPVMRPTRYYPTIVPPSEFYDSP